MAAVPSTGRANHVEGAPAPEADLTRALYERYAAQLYRYCLHQLGSREEAEDAVQSTFLNAFRGIKRGIVPELESAWLFKIAHNVCLSRRRSSWRRDRIESPTDFEVVEELVAAPPRRADELIGLQDVLEQMPGQQRRAILLREWQGLSYREICQELELSQAAVETLIFRARRSLAQGLERPVFETEKESRVHAGVLGTLVSAAQSFLLGGGAAAKVAAVVVVASASTVVATAPLRHHPAPVRQTRVPVQAPVRRQHTAPAPTEAPAVVAPPAAVHRQPAPSPHMSHRVVPVHAAVKSHGRETAPGQLKKQAVTHSSAAPPASAPAATGKARAPGQQKRHQVASPSGRNAKAYAPGRQKKHEGAPNAPAKPAPAAAAHPGNGQGKGHGK